jgi:transposase-like protein
MSRERRKFTGEYKREAVSLVLKQQLSVAEAARRLGISSNRVRSHCAYRKSGDYTTFLPVRGWCSSLPDMV